jgi:beta-lactam-binding protein with PASTA domain
VSYVVNLAPIGTVLSQDPYAGTIQPVNSGVGLVESAGGVETPNVLSLFEYEARNVLNARGLQVTVDHQKACIDPGKVIDQFPSAGAVVATGATVHITVDSSTSGTCIVK